MKKALALLIFILSFGLARAENDTITHNFESLFTTSQLVLSNSYKQGQVGDVIYVCEGSDKYARFYQDLEFPAGHKVIAINLPEQNDRVTTTRFNDLKKIVLYFTQDRVVSNLAIKLSTDSINWGEEMTLNNAYSQSSLELDTPGDYYVRMYNTSADDISIYQTKFYLVEENCNCFTYTP